MHPAPGALKGTLVNALLAHCGDSLTGMGGVARPGIVHRLDKDTSGVMVAAKTDIAHARLTEMFAAHDLDRRYQALIWGLPAERHGIIDAPLSRHRTDRKRQAVMEREPPCDYPLSDLARFATFWLFGRMPARDRTHPSNSGTYGAYRAWGDRRSAIWAPETRWPDARHALAHRPCADARVSASGPACDIARLCPSCQRETACL